MYDKVVELINQYEEKGDFTYAVVNDVIIAEAEKVHARRSYSFCHWRSFVIWPI